MKNKTILMAAVLAVATVLAAGLTVLPSSVQEAQANPCANSAGGGSAEGGNAESGAGAAGGTGGAGGVAGSGEQECTFIIGNDIDFEED